MDTSDIRRLIDMGKKRGGYLTLDELNSAVTRDSVSPEEIDEMLVQLRNHDVEVVDGSQPRAPKPRETSVRRTGDDEDAYGEVYGKSNDPVRMYLRRMGEVPLLTREGEVEIAKRIEEGELAVFNLIMETETAIGEILDRENVPIVEFGRLTEPAFQVLQRSLETCGLKSTWNHVGYGYTWDATIDRDRMYQQLGHDRRVTQPVIHISPRRIGRKERNGARYAGARQGLYGNWSV